MSHSNKEIKGAQTRGTDSGVGVVRRAADPGTAPPGWFRDRRDRLGTLKEVYLEVAADCPAGVGKLPKLYELLSAVDKQPLQNSEAYIVRTKCLTLDLGLVDELSRRYYIVSMLSLSNLRFPWNQILNLLSCSSSSLTNQKFAICKAESLWTELHECNGGHMTWTDLIDGLLQKTSVVVDNKLVIKPLFFEMAPSVRRCIFAFLVRCQRHVPVTLLHKFCNQAMKVSDDDKMYVEFLLNIIKKSSADIVTSQHSQESVSQCVSQSDYVTNVNIEHVNVTLSSSQLHNTSSSVEKCNSAVISSDEPMKTDSVLVTDIQRDKSRIKVTPVKRLRDDDESEYEPQEKVCKILNTGRDGNLRSDKSHVNIDESLMDLSDQVSTQYVRINDKRRTNQPTIDGLLTTATVNESLTRSDELKLLGTRVREMWDSGNKESDLIKQCLVSLPALELSVVLSSAEPDDIWSDNAIVACCQSAVSLHKDISFQSATTLAHSVVLPAIEKADKALPRHLSTAFSEFCKTFPDVFVESIVKPFIGSFCLGSHYVDVIVKLCKELLNVKHHSTVMRFISSKEFQWNENILLLIQSFTEMQAELTDAELNSFISCIESNSHPLNSSLKFGKLLLSVVKSYGNKMGKEEISILESVASRHSSFLKRSIQSTLSKIN